MLSLNTYDARGAEVYILHALGVRPIQTLGRTGFGSGWPMPPCWTCRVGFFGLGRVLSQKFIARLRSVDCCRSKTTTRTCSSHWSGRVCRVAWPMLRSTWSVVLGVVSSATIDYVVP